jgi:hypothetical protein
MVSEGLIWTWHQPTDRPTDWARMKGATRPAECGCAERFTRLQSAGQAVTDRARHVKEYVPNAGFKATPTGSRRRDKVVSNTMTRTKAITLVQTTVHSVYNISDNPVHVHMYLPHCQRSPICRAAPSHPPFQAFERSDPNESFILLSPGPRFTILASCPKLTSLSIS